WRARRDTPGFDPRRLAAVARAAKDLRQIAAREPRADPRDGEMAPGDSAALLALAYPDRIAQRRPGQDGRYRLANGTGAVLPPDDALGIHAYLVVAALDGAGRDARIQLALPLDEASLRRLAAERICTESELGWDAEREALSARALTRLDALVLDSRPLALDALGAVDEKARRLLLEAIAERFEQALAWTPAVRQLQARVALLRALEPEAGWPDLATETLRATLEDWLAPWLDGCTRLAETRQLDLAALLRARLDWEQQQRLDREAPEAIVTPAGNRRAIDYLAGDIPVLALPLQEVFGLGETPSIAGGRCALLLHLLSPARRPLQITRDLAGFWARGYAEVRKELRGRYPKHHWPEDPLSAQPVTGGVRRRAPRDTNQT
ncbi:MAG: ATP-dependent helicase HrpB, partial [Chromatiaceae bacterium]|nr:ATP-dependent helicase HrpB [Chromatiaceae bacterium]